jgi:importin subunit alpha-1
LASGNNDHV